MRLCQVSGTAGQTLLEALRLEHQHIDAPCGGKTRCIRCMVRLPAETAAEAQIEAPSAVEQELVGRKRLADGWRLACRARFAEDSTIAVTVPNARLDIPDFPISKAQQARLNAQARAHAAAGVSAVDTGVAPASLLSDCIVAVDIGTTTVVAVLAERGSGDVIARVAEANRQRSWGSDVVARIESAVSSPDALASMKGLIQTQIEEMLLALKRQTGLEELPPVYLCGNTTMLHLLEGEDLRGLASMPFKPAFLEARTTTIGASHIPGHLIGGISAFVGADIMAGLFACGFDKPVSAPCLLVDIGTNGEMALALPDRIYVTATAAGPAFEGELISSGSPATVGAIDHVWLDDDRKIHFSTIGNPDEQGLATGLCGSGLLDLMSCLRRLEIVDDSGAFTTDAASYSFGEGQPSLTQADVRSLQLAKGAIAAGIEILCQRAGIAFTDIETLYLAGGFGSTLLPASALDIGLLPGAVAGRIETAGNTALTGTLLLAAQPDAFERMKSSLLERITVVELAREPGFQDAFMDAMMFPEFEDV
ncbi:MAG: ASKHA domain-containing protein [Propionivibrio sp.]